MSYFRKRLTSMKYLRNSIILALMSCFIFALIVFQPSVTSADPADNLRIRGLVSNILNLTYTEMETMPMVWEETNLQCVSFPNGTPYNWTGVPLFHLLKLAGVTRSQRGCIPCRRRLLKQHHN